MMSWVTHRSMTLVSISVGILIGAIGNWWFNQPIAPWLEIHPTAATYERGSTVVLFYGKYTARKTCSRAQQHTEAGAPDPLIWRQEVQGTGPQVAILSPRPPPPDLNVGTYPFRIEIPLEKGIEPDGWRVAALVSCDTEPIAVRSRFVPVEYLPAEKVEG